MRCIAASQWKTRRNIADDAVEYRSGDLSLVSSGQWPLTVEKDVGGEAQGKRKRSHSKSYDVSFIFEHLWTKAVLDVNGIKTAATGCAGIRLPDTVIYRDGYPIAWYFQSKIDGRILRKKYESVHVLKSVESFCGVESARDNGVVAIYVVTKKVHGGPLNSIMYFDRKQLKEFILDENKNQPDGFLQRFIAPESNPMDGSKRNSTLHVTWSPYHCCVENLINMTKLGSKSSLTFAKVNIAFNNVEKCEPSSASRAP
jgi:hypothetical protein